MRPKRFPSMHSRSLGIPLRFKSTIQTKFLALIILVGILLSLLLAIAAPYQGKKLGRTILGKDAEFITHLLAENLALGLQTLDFDQGDALEQTLLLFTSDSSKALEVVSNVRVFKEDGTFITGMYGKRDSAAFSSRPDTTVFSENQQTLRSVSPLRNMDGKTLGYMEIDFSKRFLNRNVSQNTMAALVSALIVFAGTLALGVWISRGVVSGIRNAADVMRDIAEGEGDLTRRLDIQSQDEVGQLQVWVNHFMEKIHGILVQVKTNVDLVSRTADAISTTSAQLANGAEQQTTQANDAATGVEEITGSVIQNARHAGETATLADEAVRISREGAKAVEANLEGMNTVVTATQHIGQLIYSLSQRTGQIEAIVQMIDDVAIQTNLLSVNASIEAHHAGDQGAGFRVVADEVRKLAEETRISTQTIADTIRSIQKDMAQAVESMHNVEETVFRGRELAVTTKEILDRIGSTVQHSKDMIHQIAESSKLQSAGAKEISECVVEISAITKQTSSGMVDIATAARGLRFQTDALRETVSRFKLKSDAAADDDPTKASG